MLQETSIYANYNADPFYWAPFIMMDGIKIH